MEGDPLCREIGLLIEGSQLDGFVYCEKAEEEKQTFSMNSTLHVEIIGDSAQNDKAKDGT